MVDFAADGTVVHSTDLNKIYKTAGTANAVAGTGTSATGASAGQLTQYGTNVVTTNASGGFTIPYPVAFATGVITVVAMNGDAGNYSIVCNAAGQSKTQLNGIAYTANTGTGLNAVTIRINWLAVGI